MRLWLGVSVGWLLIFGWSALVAVEEVAAGEGDAEKGRRVYLGQCIACHNVRPAADGPLGPAVAGSSLELLTARIVYGNRFYAKSYPEGYTPKRPSRVMIPLPHLKPHLVDLHAYLNQR